MNFWSRLFKPADRHTFGRKVLAAMQRAEPSRAFTFDPEEFTISSSGESPQTLNLHNFYVEYCQLPFRLRRRFITHMAQTMCQSHHDVTPDSAEGVRPLLMPKVWSASAVSYLRLKGKLDGNDDPLREMPYYDLGSHLVGSVVIDLPQTMRSITRQDLENWGLSFYEALEIARANLAERPTDLACLGEELYIVFTQDAYETSRLFNLEWVRGLSLKGQPVALAPSRGNLLITGSQNVDLWEPWFELAEKSASENTHPLSLAPLILEDDMWIDWLPPSDHPLYPRICRSIDLELADGYFQQRKLLVQLQQAGDEPDAGIVPVLVTPNDPQTATTFCEWLPGCRLWLPRTSEISFGADDGNPSRRVPWDTAVRMVGHRMRQLDLYPPRWEVDEFPSYEELASLGVPLE